MRKIIVVSLLVALAVPTAAIAADTPPTAGSLAVQSCKQQREQMGAGTFGSTYGTNASRSNAFGKCVSTVAKQQQANATQASSACAAERAANRAAFVAKYGTNGLGKCVSQAAKQANAAQMKATVNAAKQCKALTAAQLAAQYGTGKNAFGKCVSARAKAQNP